MRDNDIKIMKSPEIIKNSGLFIIKKITKRCTLKKSVDLITEISLGAFINLCSSAIQNL